MAFTARYDGTCPRCLERIDADIDQITRDDGEYVHADCVDRPEPHYRGWMEGDGDE